MPPPLAGRGARSGAGQGQGACGGGRRAAAVQDDRAHRGRARLGVHPDLRPHRDLAALDDQPEARGVGRARGGERARRLSRAGVPAVGVRMAVDGEGEILARSNHVFEGYWNQPEETAKALQDGWFHTGDGGHEDGAYVVIADRKKDVIITGGENVSSIDVEDCLFQHPAVAEAAVIGVPDEKWGETVKALVVLRPGFHGDRARSDRFLPRPPRPLQVPDVDRDPRCADSHRHGQAPEVQATRAVLEWARAACQLASRFRWARGPTRPGELAAIFRGRTRAEMSIETFTIEERRALAPYFTNLDGPVFALVNLPEIVKGALFARYSRSAKSLRRLFLDEFLDQVRRAARRAPSDRHDARRAALRARVQRVRRRLRRAARRRAPGLRGRVEHPDQGARVGPADGLPRAVDALRARTPTGRAAAGSTTCRRELDGHPLRARYVETLDRAFETYARWIEPMREYWSRRFPKPAERQRRGLPRRPSAPRRSTRCAACCPRPRARTSGSSAPAQAYEALLLRMRAHPLARGAAVRGPDARRAPEGHPGVSDAVDRPGARRRWSRYLAETREETARVAQRLLDGDRAGAAARGDAHRLRPGRRGQGRGRRAVRRVGPAGRPAARPSRASSAPEERRQVLAPTSGRATTGATSRDARSSARATASTCSPTTARSAISSATGCSRSSGSRSRRATAT